MSNYQNRIGNKVNFIPASAIMTRQPVPGEESKDAGRLVVGQKYSGRILRVVNAGFRGIEMTITLDDGRRVSGINESTIVK